jgi:hypothetical protein
MERRTIDTTLRRNSSQPPSPQSRVRLNRSPGFLQRVEVEEANKHIPCRWHTTTSPTRTVRRGKAAHG